MYTDFKPYIHVNAASDTLKERQWVRGKDIALWEPIKTNKYILASWYLGGSVFVREFLRENFPMVANIRNWGKTHVPLDDEIVQDLKRIGAKVVVVITDPREIGMNLLHFDNGKHYNPDHYNGAEPGSVEFFDQIVDKQFGLIDFYNRNFKTDSAVIRYEDALYDQKPLLEQLFGFFGGEQPPLHVDDARKYKWSCYKAPGDFWQFFDHDVLREHYRRNIHFYKLFNYLPLGHVQWRYGNHFQHSENYKDMLKRNGVNGDGVVSDAQRF